MRDLRDPRDEPIDIGYPFLAEPEKDHVRIGSEDLVPEISFKAAHNRDDDDQGHNTQRYPATRDQRDERDKRLPPLRFQVPQPDKEFIRHRYSQGGQYPLLWGGAAETE